MLFGHGDDYYRSDKAVRINFSSNVWHGTDLSGLKAYLQDRFEVLTRYPDPDASALKSVLADCYGVDERQLVVTNGSITAFYLLAQAWPGSRSAIAVPSFSEYEDACRLYRHTIRFFPTSVDLRELSMRDIDLCWICNPNNPDGRLYTRVELLELIASYPETLFIIDQAYQAFTAETLLFPSDVSTHPNLLLIQSISKAHSVPGLRIGYLVASPEKVERINRYLIPWSVNAIAIEAGKYMLTHPEQYDLPILAWQQETACLIKGLNELGWIEAYPTAVTFFLARLKDRTAAALKRYLWEQKGILIRDASNFRGLTDSYIRLSTQRAEENRSLIDALSEWHTL